MKKRRTLVISLLLVAALALGIGYAAISDVLVIDGTVTVNEQPFQLVYVSYEETSASDGVTSYVQGTIADNTVAKLNVSGFSHVDDKMVGVFTVRNDNDVTLYVDEDPVVKCGSSATSLTDTRCNNFDCQIVWNAMADGKSVHTDGIPAGAEATFTITLKLTKVPDELSQGTIASFAHYFRIDIPATSVNPNS